MSDVKPIPDGYHSVSAYLIVENTSEALEFYAQAFGAETTVLLKMPGEDRIMHAEMRIGNSMVMISDECPQFGARSAKTIGGSPISMHIYVEDVDASFQQAISAGCEVVMPLMDVFWGDRFGKVKDKFGIEWGLATHIKDVPEEEMPELAAKAMAEMVAAADAGSSGG